MGTFYTARLTDVYIIQNACLPHTLDARAQVSENFYLKTFSYTYILFFFSQHFALYNNIYKTPNGASKKLNFCCITGEHFIK